MKHKAAQLKTLIDDAIDVLLPPRCAVTGDIVDAQGMMSSKAWGALDFTSAPFCVCCGTPFDFDVDDDELCGDCAHEAPIFDSARSALLYGDMSRNLILGFKHGDKTHMVQSFVPWLMRTGADILGQADLIVPVPLHRWRLLSRRYNQAALIAGALSKESGKPYSVTLLRRLRATPSQGHLKTAERMENVRSAFDVHPKELGMIRDKTIVLVDDVLTTGATVNECAKVLKAAGASQVHVLTLARVVQDY